MNRREFARLSALSLVAGQLPNLGSAQTGIQVERKIGYAAVGLGAISDIFMKAVANSTTTKITALVSGHPDKAARYAEQYGVPKDSIYNYEDFDRIRDNKGVDATYIGLPNSMHKEFTIRSAQAGKHVLCEKPMAISSLQCREMIGACRKANVKLMIAYRIHYDPTHLQAVELIQSGKLGQIEYFEGGFGGNFAPNQWRLTKALGGGGSLLDMGIYPLNAIRFYTGEEPAQVAAFVSTRDRQSGRFTEVEQSISWTMKFPSGILANCASSYGANGGSFLHIHGTQGMLVLNPAYNYQGVYLRGSYYDPETKHATEVDVPSAGRHPFQFQIEAEHFAECIREDKEPRTPGEEGLRDLEAIEKIYASAGTPIA
jgi:predicted dehydrogenase